MTTLAQLRKQAKIAGIPATDIRGAETAQELQTVIDNFNGSSVKSTSTRAVKKAVAKKKSGRTTKTKAASKKSSAVKTKPAAKKSAAKRSPARKTATRKTSTAKRNSDSGRNLLDGVDFKFTDGWNARDGSAPDRIIKALAKKNGNRDKVFDLLAPDVWDFVGKKMANGTKRSKSDALAMLAYRIARTAWDFAMRTGQHDKAENRAEYGQGGTGRGVWKSAASRKRASSRGSKSKTSTKRGTAKKSTARRKTTRRK